MLSFDDLVLFANNPFFLKNWKIIIPLMVEQRQQERSKRIYLRLALLGASANVSSMSYKNLLNTNNSFIVK